MKSFREELKAYKRLLDRCCHKNTTDVVFTDGRTIPVCIRCYSILLDKEVRK